MSKPLGAPVAGPTITTRPVGTDVTEVLYQRRFGNRSSVTLNVSTGRNPWTHCCIKWADGTNSTCSAGDCNP